MKLVKMVDLVAQDVTGMIADLRSRKANGELTYPHQEREHIQARLKSVVWEWHKISHKDASKSKWLYWKWETQGLSLPYSCGYGGTASADDFENLYIQIVN